MKALIVLEVNDPAIAVIKSTLAFMRQYVLNDKTPGNLSPMFMEMSVRKHIEDACREQGIVLDEEQFKNVLIDEGVDFRLIFEDIDKKVQKYLGDCHD